MTDAVTAVCLAETADNLMHQSRQVLAMKQHTELIIQPSKISHNIQNCKPVHPHGINTIHESHPRCSEKKDFFNNLQHSWAQKG